MYEKKSDVIVQKKLAEITNVKSIKQHKGPKDIYYAVKPFYMFLQVFGLQKIKFKKNDNQKTSIYVKIYSFIIAAVLCVAQCYVIHVNTYTKYTDMTSANIITDLLDTIPGAFSAVVSLIMSATCVQGMILRVFNNFSIVDKKLSIEKNNIYKPLRVKTTVIMTLLVLATIIHYTYDRMFWNVEASVFSVGFFIAIIKELILLEVTLLIYIDGDRLDVMNKQLANLKKGVPKKIDNGIYNIKKKHETMTMAFFNQINAAQNKEPMDQEEQVDDLTRLMRIYDRIVDNANIINSCYGIQMLTACIAVFINILTTVNNLISIKSINTNYASSIFWCMRDLFFVTLAIVSCERLQSKVKNTSDTINKLSIDPKMDVHEQELLERFSQLIACRKTTMTACNFFPFDFTFIYSLVGAVATYTVILLQVNQGRAATPKPPVVGTTTMPDMENVTFLTDAATAV